MGTIIEVGVAIEARTRAGSVKGRVLLCGVLVLAWGLLAGSLAAKAGEGCVGRLTVAQPPAQRSLDDNKFLTADQMLAPFELNVDFGRVVTLDVMITQDVARMQQFIKQTVQLSLEQWGNWSRWLQRNGLSSDDGQTTAMDLRHLQIMYGPEVGELLTGSGPIVLLPPAKGHIHSGRFRLQGTLHVLKKFIDRQRSPVSGNRFNVIGVVSAQE